MSLRNILIGVLLVAAVGLVLVFTEKAPPLGANPGPDYYDTQYFFGDFVSGNGCYSTTTTGVLTSNVLARNSCINITAAGAGQAAIVLTTQASTTMNQLVPKAGMCREWWINAADVAAATTTTIAAGTGVNIVGLDATGAGTGADVIDGAEYGSMKLCKELDSDYVLYVQENIHAD